MGDLAAGDNGTAGDTLGFLGDGDRGDLDKMADIGASDDVLTGAGDLALETVLSDLEPGERMGRGVPGQSITKL
jgi:hypothetical protein